MVFPVKVLTTARGSDQKRHFQSKAAIILTDLHASSKTEDKMKSGFFLNIVIRESTAIFELFSGKDQTLLIRRYSFLVLNFGLYIVDGVARLNLKGNGLAGDYGTGCQICQHFDATFAALEFDGLTGFNKNLHDDR
jgi:hypothetical protein